MTTFKASVNSNGEAANALSVLPSISGDGRFVVYGSYATNLVDGDSNGFSDIFLYDTVTKTTIRLSVNSNGEEANGDSGSFYSLSINASGRYVAYNSSATNLVTGDSNGFDDIFLYDTVTKTTTKVSVSSNGGQGNGASYGMSISGDGRYVAYQSEASNLVAGDTNGHKDIFVFDTLTKQTTRVNVSSNGSQTNAGYFTASPAISSNGRYVAYSSEATNLVAADTNNNPDVFVYDMVTKQTTRVSVNSNGVEANSASSIPSISADGRYVAYVSYASNLVEGDNNERGDIFLYDTLTKKTTRVNVSSSAQEANNTSFSPSISSDGRYVAYHSEASNLVAGDSNGKEDIFVYDTVTKKTTRVSVGNRGEQAGGEFHLLSTYSPAISGDGKYVAYTSDAANLVTGDNNTESDIFVSDINFNRQDVVAFAKDSFSVRENGSVVSAVIITRSNPSNTSALVTFSAGLGTATKGIDYNFSSISVSFAPGETLKTITLPTILDDTVYEGNENIYLYLTNPTGSAFLGSQQIASLTILDNDGLKVGDTFRANVTSNGEEAIGGSFSPAINNDGRYVAYMSYAPNLVPGDNNYKSDVFVYDRLTKNTTRVSVADNGKEGDQDSGNSFDLPSISGDGRYVVYSSDATNLVPGDTNTKDDIFVYDRVTKKTNRVSVNSNGEQALVSNKNDGSFYPSLSASGRYVAYSSDAFNLVAGDSNGKEDIFVYDLLLKTTTRVSVNSNGDQAMGGLWGSISPSISANGRYIAYESDATNLASFDVNESKDIFVYDLVDKKNTRVSVNSNGNQGSENSYSPAISGDGRYVAYVSRANNLVSGDTNGLADVFLYNLLTKKTNRVSVSSNGTQSNGDSFNPSISSNGRYVAYRSAASNLVSDDSNGVPDIFVYDTLTKKTTRVNLNSNGQQSILGNFGSFLPAISGDGNYVTYYSVSSDLVGGDNNKTVDIFVSYGNHLTKDIIAFNSTNFTLNENGIPVAPVTVTRANASNNSVKATLKLTDGSAKLPQDYKNSLISVSFGVGETSKTIAIPLVNDALIEGNESLNLSLINPTGGAILGATKTALLTIVDNDTAGGIDQTGSSLNDTLTGGNGNDVISGSFGNDSLNGALGNDVLHGNVGNDTLRGGALKDYLKGGTGNDSFVFNAPSDGVDSVADFSVVDDTILVSASRFGGGLVAGGAISSTSFAIGTAATTSSQRFIYNQTTGSLSFDVDGSGASLQQQLANLTPHLALTNSDIVVI